MTGRMIRIPGRLGERVHSPGQVIFSDVSLALFVYPLVVTYPLERFGKKEVTEGCG